MRVTQKTGRGSDQFMLRFPPDMRDRIKAAADESGRSMNAEIIQTLMKTYPEVPTVENSLMKAELLSRLIAKKIENGEGRDATRYSSLLVERLKEALRGLDEE